MKKLIKIIALLAITTSSFSSWLREIKDPTHEYTADLLKIHSDSSLTAKQREEKIRELKLEYDASFKEYREYITNKIAQDTENDPYIKETRNEALKLSGEVFKSAEKKGWVEEGTAQKIESYKH